MPMTVVLDALPLNDLLEFVIHKVKATAEAAIDVCLEKRSFNELSVLLNSIHAILAKLPDQNLNENPAVAEALKYLDREVSQAGDLIVKVKNYSLFRHIIYCRHTLKEFQTAVSAISGAFEALRLSFPEVAVDLADGIETVNEQLRCINYTADTEHLAIAEELERGMREWRMDNQVANNILNSILRSIGRSHESPQISQELASLRKDKEAAAMNKALQLDYFLDQVISLLSSADAAYSLEESLLKYRKRKENYSNESLEPYNSFICPISKVIMHDPVTASNETTYERNAIEQWFEKNGFTDPDTHAQLPSGKLRPNRALFGSIMEWTEQGNVGRILHAKNKLQSGDGAKQNEACRDLLRLCEEGSQYKDWIASEDLIPLMIKLVQSQGESREGSLYCLRTLVQNNERNKLYFVQADGIRFVARCLARQKSGAKAALMLLAEMVNNDLAREQMENAQSFFLWVVTRRLNNENDSELIRAADYLLDQLSDKDENIVEMLKVNWCGPLVNKFHQGTDDVKLKIANVLSRVELHDDMKQKLAEKDIVKSLVLMLHSGDMHSKLASLKALQMLSSNSEVRHSMEETGAVSILSDLVSNETTTVSLSKPAFAMIESLLCSPGTKYLVDSKGLPDQEAMVRILIGTLNTSTPAVHPHVLKCLSKLAQGSTFRNTRDLIRERMQVEVVVSFLAHGGPEIRELTAVLLNNLSADDGESEFASFLSEKASLELLAEQMKNSTGLATKIAAAGIMANLANHHRTMRVPKPVLQALLDMLMCDEVNVVESALDALQKLTDLPDVNIKMSLASLDIFSCLKQTLRSTSSIAKIKAATILRNLSLTTPSLVAHCTSKDQLWPGSSWCKVHVGRCEAKRTLCIIKANLVPQLVALLSDRESQVAEAGMDALSTLFSSDRESRNAAEVLCDAKVMKPLSHLLTRKSHGCYEKAQMLLNKIEIAPKRRHWYSHFPNAR